jgi:hypothetical protein
MEAGRDRCDVGAEPRRAFFAKALVDAAEVLEDAGDGRACSDLAWDADLVVWDADLLI